MPLGGCFHGAGQFVRNEVDVRPCAVSDVPQIIDCLLEEFGSRRVRLVAGGGRMKGSTVGVRRRLTVGVLHTKLHEELLDVVRLGDVQRRIRVT